MQANSKLHMMPMICLTSDKPKTTIPDDALRTWYYNREFMWHLLVVHVWRGMWHCHTSCHHKVSCTSITCENNLGCFTNVCTPGTGHPVEFKVVGRLTEECNTCAGTRCWHKEIEVPNMLLTMCWNAMATQQHQHWWPCYCGQLGA